MSSILNTLSNFKNLISGSQGFRISFPRIFHKTGVFYKGYVYDSNLQSLPVVLRLSEQRFGSLNLYGITMRVFKDEKYIKESMIMNTDDKDKSNAFYLSQSGVIADAFFVQYYSEQKSLDITNFNKEIFSNHVYTKPTNVKDLFILVALLTLTRLTGAFPLVVKIDNFLKLLGYNPLSDNISDKSISSLNINSDSEFHQLTLYSHNNEAINIYIDKNPLNPDSSSDTLDTNNIKFIHQLEQFNLLPKYKRTFWFNVYIFRQYIVYTYRYITNTLSNNIYDEIPYEYKKIQEISYVDS